MKNFAQGEITATKITAIPEEAVEINRKEMKNQNGHWIISHSEKGHHHLLDGEGVTLLENPKLPDIFYAIVKNPHAKLWQDAAVPHGEHVLDAGFYRFTIAREYDPFLQQARRVAD